MLQVRCEAVIATEPMRVWEVLANHEGMDKWANMKKVVRIRPGTPDPNGVGAVRRLYATGLTMEERIRTFIPGRLMEYDVLEGAPGWTARGKIMLLPLGDSETLLWWRVSLHPYLRSASQLVRSFLQHALEGAVTGLKNRLEPEPLWSGEKRIAEAVVETMAVPPVPRWATSLQMPRELPHDLVR